MKNTKKLSAVLFIIAGIFMLISAIVGKNYTFYPIGACFIILGIVNSKSDDNSKDSK